MTGSEMTTVVVGRGSNRVEMSVGEVMPAGSLAADDRRIKVSVTCGGFSVHDREVWVSAAAWARFDRELHALEASRRGEAQLVSQSPQDLRLRLYAWDSAGHIAVEGHVGKHLAAASRAHEIGLRFAFDMDSELLGAVVREFDALPPAI
jgi:hypothetical protein